MALFPTTQRIDGSRSNTGLVISGHASPAQKWILDPKFANEPTLTDIYKDGYLFTYTYGGPQMTEVVIAKGRGVITGKSIMDYETQKLVPIMTLPGLAGVNYGMGVVPYNITRDHLQQDQLGGNAPTILTQEYIELPYIPSVIPSTLYTAEGVAAEETALSVNLKNPWGAVIGATTQINDFVKLTPSGRFTRWIPGTDSTHLIMGQIIGEDMNQETMGWMKWATVDEFDKIGSTYEQEGGGFPGLDGYNYDPDYEDGNALLPQNQVGPQGIPGLTDGTGNYLGYGRNDTLYTDIALDNTPAAVVDGDNFDVQALDYGGGNLINLIANANFVVKIGGVAIDPTRYNVVESTGLITVSLLAADANKTVTASYNAIHLGVDSSYDFKGVVGSFKILLQK